MSSSGVSTSMARRGCCLTYIPRLGIFVCVFLLGGLLSYYFLQTQKLDTNLDDIHRNNPHYKCVEIEKNADKSKPPNTVHDMGLSLDVLEKDVNHDVTSGLMESKSKGVEPIVHRVGSQLDLLSPGLVTNIVHYLWCEKKIFEYQHYLSVRSVVTHINPDRIIFHYGAHYPRYDTQFYHTWFEDMKMEFPFIYLDALSSKPEVCQSPENQIKYIKNVLNAQGGIYVHYNTVFLKFPFEYRNNVQVDALTSITEGFLIMPQGSASELSSAGTANVIKHQCMPADLFMESLRSVCAIRKGPYFPRDAWGKNDDFSKGVNKLLYGDITRPVAKPSGGDPIPNVGHLFWVDGAEMPFLFYLNCLSQLYILKVDRLYIHGNAEPSGKYWDLIKKEPKLTFVKRLKYDVVFRQNVTIINHMADIFRVDILSRFGGIYTDTDAVWVNPIPKELWHYDVVATYDWPQMYNVFPDYINFGVTLGKPGAPFWTYFMHSFKEFKDNMYAYNGLLRPYKVFERHPDLVHIYDKLQVICWDMRCHPTWYDDFRLKNSDHKNHPDFNWRDAHNVHFTEPTPTELTSAEALAQSTDNMYSQIGRHIMKAAGKI